MSWLTEFYGWLRIYLDFGRPELLYAGPQIRDAVALFLVGFYGLVPIVILFDRSAKGTAAAASNATDANDSDSEGPDFGLVLALALIGLVVLAPDFIQERQYGLLCILALLTGIVLRPSFGNRVLTLRAPRAPTGLEILGVLGLCALAAALALYRWESLPVGINYDEVKFARSSVELWRGQGRHPFFLTSAGIPAVVGTLQGLLMGLPDDAILGMRLFPALCGVLSAMVVYRWLCMLSVGPFPWFAAVLFVALPFYQYYSRTACGTSLIYAQVVFLYGVTRSFACPGVLGPLLGGVALGVAQWDYPSSRLLILFAITIPFVVLPWRRFLATGWVRRWLALGFVALPLVLLFPTIEKYDPKSWTWYMSVGGYNIEDSPVFTEPEKLWKRIQYHLDMWFRTETNAHGPLTVAGTSILPHPMSAIFVLGMGLLPLSLRAPAVALILWMFLIGVAASFLGTGAPANPHRAMLAEVPVAAIMALTACTIWRSPGPRFAISARRVIAAALVAWSAWAGIDYFHGDLWADRRAWDAQSFGTRERAMAMRRDQPSCDVVAIPEAYEIDKFLLKEMPPLLDFSNWLPTNWSKKPVCGHGGRHRMTLTGLVRSVIPPERVTETWSPYNSPGFWSYRTDGERIGDRGVEDQWRERRSVEGSLMVPRSGTMRVDCSGFRCSYSSPLGETVVEGQGDWPVISGLGHVRIESTQAGQEPPRSLAIVYQPDNGPAEEHLLAPRDLFSIPVHGWLRTVVDRDRESGEERVYRWTFPTLLYLRWRSIDPPFARSIDRRTTFSAVASLPPGSHRLFLVIRPSCPVLVTVDGEPLPLFEPNMKFRELYKISADAERINGRRIEVTTQGDCQAFLEVEGPVQGYEVPPYNWFTPVNRRANQLPIGVQD